MSVSVVRSSKFRHVFGEPCKRYLGFDGIRVGSAVTDASNIIYTHPDYLAICWEAQGGGSFAVIPTDHEIILGSRDINREPRTSKNYPIFLFKGHKAAILDLAWHPFYDSQGLLASASEDAHVGIWRISDQLRDESKFKKSPRMDTTLSPGISDPMTSMTMVPDIYLSGHARRVTSVMFHPCVAHLLASASADNSIRVWDVAHSKHLMNFQHTDTIHSFIWSHLGDLIVCTSRDKQLHLFDPRILKEVQHVVGHESLKMSRICWLGDTDRFITTGFGKTSDRQLFLWDRRQLQAGPIHRTSLGAASGILMPFFDNDTQILFLAGKGDSTVQFYEMLNEEPYFYYLSEYRGVEPQRGFAFVPKRSVNTKTNEIMKAYKLQSTYIESISFRVPRRVSQLFTRINKECLL